MKLNFETNSILKDETKKLFIKIKRKKKDLTQPMLTYQTYDSGHIVMMTP